MIKMLRSYMNNATAISGKKYLITGAPQCVLPEINMGSMIAAVEFDALYIQFYNNPSCSANATVTSTTGFNYATWVTKLQGTPNSATKLYIGLPGSASDVSALNPHDFLLPLRVQQLVNNTVSSSQFGGVMIWEATGALGSIVTTAQVPWIGSNVTYFAWVKEYCLLPFAPPPPPPTSSSSTVTSTTTT